MEFIRKYAKQLLIAAGAIATLTILIVLLVNSPSSTVAIWVEGQPQPMRVNTRSNIPAIIFNQAGVSLSNEDRVYINGIQVSPEKPVEDISNSVIQIQHAYRIDLTIDGQPATFHSAAPTLGRALWENNIILRTNDYISIPLDLPLSADVQVTIRRSQPVRILVQGQEIILPTAAESIGQALAMAGIALQNLDYSQPGEDESIPADRTIKVVRVREEIQLQPKPIPFTNEYVADAQTDIDTQKVLQAGEYGLRMTRERVRYEDGKEVSRETEAEWLAKAPVNQKYAYGTKINIQTLSTPDGTIEYWRAVSVWITSYRDTGSKTASGKWPTKGDIAVNPAWYRYMKGTRLYIPGYGFGTVTDVCPGCVGKPWIDVFIPTAEYVGWHTTQVVYFLTPVPANPLWVLP